ncbi:MAG: oxygen-independent coproporphyrinogen-III oxidase [Cyanobacteriota bacterium]
MVQRNFQGYTTHAETELFGFSATSISMLEDAYAQNHRELKDYYKAIAAGVIPTSKGIKLTHDDIIRRDVIMSIMSHFRLNKSEIEQKYHINFDQYFSYKIQELQPLQNDGLVNVFVDEIHITDIGRLLIRNIAVLFDTHTRTRETKFSRAI